MADSTSTPTMSTAPTDPNAKQWLIVVTNIIPIVLVYTMLNKGKEAFYVWHSKNAAGAFVIGFIIQLAYQILWRNLNVSLFFILDILNIINLILGVLMIYGAYEGWQGKQPTLPLITQIGQKIPLEKWFNKSAAPAVSAPSASPAPTSAPASTPATPAAPTAPESTPPTPPVA